MASAAGFTQSGGFAAAAGMTASAATQTAKAMHRILRSCTTRSSEYEREPADVVVDDLALLEHHVEPVAGAAALAEHGARPAGV